MSPPVGNGTLAHASSTSIDNEVSWPSILWALLPIAFNSMTQPVGRLAVNITPEHSFYFRASPFLCALEACAVLCQFLYLTIRTGNPSLGIDRISWAKLDVSNGVERTQMQKLQNNDVFRMVLFIFGVLPQAIKLYACKGIPASQALASFYLGSWTILELLVVMPARYGIFKYSWYASSARASLNIDPLVELICNVAYHYCDFVALYFMYTKFEGERQAWTEYVAGFVLKAIYLFIFCARGVGPGAEVFETYITLFIAAYFCNLEFLESLWLFGIRSGLWVAGIAIRRPAFNRFGGVAFFFMQLLTAVGSYGFMYDPAGTSKPAWTEYLG
ncbi:MAG: hypothetical protein Q9221_004070 [Calogaya cf. arnoldii]